jgi:POT family proton-dependent oligopeptide transporter
LNQAQPDARAALNAALAAAASRARRDRAFLGHPAGLGWLSFAEFWERFSYYGMQALLVLYMTHFLLQPGHVEHVVGFAAFRHAIESVFGALSPQALASEIFGLYAGLVYLTPIAGGLLADRLTGRTTAVALGAALMALGHFLMAYEASFLLALACLLAGVGCFKGNISTQVGELYGRDDPRRADGFQIFLIAVQLAVIASPLVCGTLGEVYGWHWGFGAAGVGMLIGLAVYLYGRPSLPVETRRSQHAAVAKARAPLGKREWHSVLILIGLVPVLALAAVGNQEIFNAYLVWAETNYQLVFFGKQMPVTWILSFGSIISAATIVLSLGFWRWWARRWPEPDEITKIATGAGVAALAPMLLAIASAGVAASGRKAGIGWAFAFEIINDIGFANVFPVGLALYSRAAPKGLSGVLVGVFFLHLFVSNLLVGWLGGWLERMSGVAFWAMHAAIILSATAILLLVRVTAGRTLAPAYHLMAEAQSA